MLYHSKQKVFFTVFKAYLNRFAYHISRFVSSKVNSLSADIFVCSKVHLLSADRFVCSKIHSLSANRFVCSKVHSLSADRFLCVVRYNC